MRPSCARVLTATAILTAIASIAPTSGANAPKPGVDWPQFRGIAAQGTADGTRMPTAWNVKDPKTVRWSAAIPGLGLSSPVVWGDLVCMTTAISGKPEAGIKPGL